METKSAIDKSSPSYQLGYSDAVKYGIPRNLRDFPDGTLQREYDAGYRTAARKCNPKNQKAASHPVETKSTTPTIQKVVFRATRRKNPEVSAVLIGQPSSPTAPLTAWHSQGGHSNATYGWYYSTRPAKPAEYAEELEKLQRQYAPEFKIVVRQKLS